MATCNNHNCGIVGHSYVLSTNKHFVFKIPQFYWLSCFDIAHHELSTGLFTAMSSSFAMVNNQKCPQNSQQQKSTKMSHIECNMIQGMCTEVYSKQNYDCHAKNINK